MKLIDKIMDWAVSAALVSLFLAFVTAAIWWHFHVWRLVHPGAPLWTFFFGR